MGFPMLVRWYLYIESGPWAHGIDLSLQEYSGLGNRTVTAVHISDHIIIFSKLFIEDTHSFPMNTIYGIIFWTYQTFDAHFGHTFLSPKEFCCIGHFMFAIPYYQYYTSCYDIRLFPYLQVSACHWHFRGMQMPIYWWVYCSPVCQVHCSLPVSLWVYMHFPVPKCQN